MVRLIFSPVARQDLIDIFDYIAKDKPLAAGDWVESVEQKCQLLTTAPEIGELRPEFGTDIRSTTVGRYVVFYRLMTNAIEVIRVIAGDRDIRSLY